MSRENIDKALAREAGGHDVVQAGPSFVTSDATETPVTSPVTSSGADDIITLIVPKNAVELYFWATNDVSYSEVSNCSTSYGVKFGTEGWTGCSMMEKIYIKCPTDGTIVNFKFVTLGA